MPTALGDGWTDDRVKLLRALWADGLSASQIAGELGGFLTRNAVIGKVHRLGLDGRAKRTPRPVAHFQRGRPLRPLGARPAVQPSGDVPPVAPEPEPPAVDMLDVPLEQRRTLLQLTDETCRWPYGEPSSPEFYFCGGKSLVPPYCIYHNRLAYTPAAERRREYAFHPTRRS